jgi:hypothetical protein
MEIGAGPLGGLEGGSALIVATVGTGGMPHANRAWGVTVLDRGNRFRVILDADDDVMLVNLRATGRVAVTGCDVVSLRSVQVKGRVEALEPVTARDLALRERCTELFFRDVEETDRTPRELLDRLVPGEFVACVVTVDEVYDQTPGPAAGAAVEDHR